MAGAGADTSSAARKPLTAEGPSALGWPRAAAGVALACFFLYVFLVGLALLGDAFKCLGGRSAGNLFGAISNPIAGLMTGILATVLVQSSSTSTSIVVGLVGAHQMSVKTGIPIIMGANIGTSVTNTLVSMGQSGDRITLQRSFAGATVHDMFNILTVLCLLPLEVVVGAIQGEGGALYWITKVIADAAMGSGSKKEDPLKGKSPTKIITSPLTKAVIVNNKHVINALALGAPAAMSATWVNATAGCGPIGRRLMASSEKPESTSASRALLSRRLSDGLGGMDCSRYFCVGKELKGTFKKISKSGYKKLTSCGGYIAEVDIEVCGEDRCFLDAGAYYTRYVEQGRIIKGGFVEGAGDMGGGAIALVLSLILLCGGLVGLCKVLSFLFMGGAKRAIVAATRTNDYVAMLVGCLMTVVVQSSSVVTSVLTPLCGIGLLPLAKMFPMSLGANVGTTATALIAALSAFTHDAVHIALCHLVFNLEGILIWFPAPVMRRVPLGAAKLLGLYAAHFRLVPVIYVVVVFVIVPGVLLGVSALFEASVAGGVVVSLLLLGAVAAFEFWWLRLGGCNRLLSEEARAEGRRALQEADKELAGDAEAPEAPEAQGQAGE
mmetsp:Transcript_49696/g.138011  ORF Transcript_49696/g.138011 Transcript_49696/m.138011 type:complete len:608 (+) Transcript_49696:73-1896(+)